MKILSAILVVGFLSGASPVLGNRSLVSNFCSVLHGFLFGYPKDPQYPRELDKKIDLVVGNNSYVLTKIIGKSSAYSLQSADEKTVIKVYDKSTAYLAFWEYWGTRYLQEQGFPVADCPMPPFNTNIIRELNEILPEKFTSVWVVVKPFYDGDVLTSLPRPDSLILEKINRLKENIEQSLRQGFAAWFADQGVALPMSNEQKTLFDKMSREGDAYVIWNWMIHEGAPLLLDP